MGIWKAHNMIPLLLSDTTPNFPVSFWRTENLGHLPFPTFCESLACGWHSGNMSKTKQVTQVYSLLSSTICAFSPWHLCSQDFLKQKRPLFFFLFLCLFQFNLFLRMHSTITSLIKVNLRTSSDYPLVALTLHSGSNCHNRVWIRSTAWQYRDQEPSSESAGWTLEYRSKTQRQLPQLYTWKHESASRSIHRENVMGAQQMGRDAGCLRQWQVPAERKVSRGSLCWEKLVFKGRNCSTWGH